MQAVPGGTMRGPCCCASPPDSHSYPEPQPQPQKANVTDSRYFQDFQLGETWSSSPTLISAEEIMAFGRAYDPQPMHTDPALAVAGPFGRLVASGWLIASISVRVFVEAGGYGRTPLVGLGIDELRWQRTVQAGDTLTFTREVVQLRRSASSPGHGIIRTRVTAGNQHGDSVMTLFTAGRVPVRPACAEASAATTGGSVA
jgi:acyl dehydratase